MSNCTPEQQLKLTWNAKLANNSCVYCCIKGRKAIGERERTRRFPLYEVCSIHTYSIGNDSGLQLLVQIVEVSVIGGVRCWKFHCTLPLHRTNVPGRCCCWYILWIHWQCRDVPPHNLGNNSLVICSSFCRTLIEVCAQNGELRTHCQTGQCVSGYLAFISTASLIEITSQHYNHKQAHVCARAHTHTPLLTYNLLCVKVNVGY